MQVTDPRRDHIRVQRQRVRASQPQNRR
jgi:hypothetical protein